MLGQTDRYLLRALLKGALAGWLGLTLLLLVLRLIQLTLLDDPWYSFSERLVYLAISAPYQLFSYESSLGLLFGAIFVLLQLGAQNELIAAQNLGQSFRRQAGLAALTITLLSAFHLFGMEAAGLRSLALASNYETLAKQKNIKDPWAGALSEPTDIRAVKNIWTRARGGIAKLEGYYPGLYIHSATWISVPNKEEHKLNQVRFFESLIQHQDNVFLPSDIGHEAAIDYTGSLPQVLDSVSEPLEVYETDLMQSRLQDFSLPDLMRHLSTTTNKTESFEKEVLSRLLRPFYQGVLLMIVLILTLGSNRDLPLGLRILYAFALVISNELVFRPAADVYSRLYHLPLGLTDLAVFALLALIGQCFFYLRGVRPTCFIWFKKSAAPKGSFQPPLAGS